MPRPQWFSLRFAGKGAALALGSGAAVSLYIDSQWRTFEQSKTDVTVNPYIPTRGNGLAGYSFTAYNSPSAALKEAVVEYPFLGSRHRQDGSGGSDTAVPLVDVCVVGGGFAGLHAALALAEKRVGGGFNKADGGRKEGRDLHRSIAVLEANRVGSGASGACGGMAIVGYETELELLEWVVGPHTAKALFSHSIAGYERLKRVIRDYKIQCGMVEEGLLEMMLANRFISDKSGKSSLHSIGGKEESADKNVVAIVDYAAVEEEMKSTAQACKEEEEHYGQVCNVLSKETIEKTMGLSSDRFAYGCFNPRTFSVNPLALVFGLARACVGTGRVSIYERSRVVCIEREPLPADASTDGGNVSRLLDEQMRERGLGGGDVAEFLNTKTFANALRGDEALRERMRLAATYDKFGAGDFVVTTANGGVLKAKEVVLATNAVPWELRPSLAMLTAPCTTSIMLTRPFTSRDGGAKASSVCEGEGSVVDMAKAELNKVFSFKGCVIDERFGLVYFRRIEGDRILFGGLASGKPFCARGTGPNGGGIDLTKDVSRGGSSPAAKERLGEDATTMSVAATRLADEFSRTFPTLAPFLEVEECWEGRIEHRDTMFPLVGRDPRDGLWYSFGFSGHGVVPTCAAGDLLASAIHSMRHPSESLLLAGPHEAPPSTSAGPNPLFLEPTDRRYELWKEVSFFPSAAFKRAKAELESRHTSGGLGAGKQGHSESTCTTSSSSSPFICMAPLELSGRDSLSRRSSSSSPLSWLGSSRYTPIVLPPSGFPLTSVLPYLFVDYGLPLWEWWQGAI